MYIYIIHISQYHTITYMYEVCFIMLKSDQRRQQADKIHILHRYFLWLKHYSSVEKKGEAHKT